MKKIALKAVDTTTKEKEYTTDEMICAKVRTVLHLGTDEQRKATIKAVNTLYEPFDKEMKTRNVVYEPLEPHDRLVAEIEDGIGMLDVQIDKLAVILAAVGEAKRNEGIRHNFNDGLYYSVHDIVKALEGIRGNLQEVRA